MYEMRRVVLHLPTLMCAESPANCSLTAMSRVSSRMEKNKVEMEEKEVPEGEQRGSIFNHYERPFPFVSSDSKVN